MIQLPLLSFWKSLFIKEVFPDLVTAESTTSRMCWGIFPCLRMVWNFNPTYLFLFSVASGSVSGSETSGSSSSPSLLGSVSGTPFSHLLHNSKILFLLPLLPPAAGFLKGAPLLLGFFKVGFKTFVFDFGAALVFAATVPFPLAAFGVAFGLGEGSGASSLVLVFFFGVTAVAGLFKGLSAPPAPSRSTSSSHGVGIADATPGEIQALGVWGKRLTSLTSIPSRH